MPKYYEGREVLYAVVTLTEAVERWHKQRKTIERAIDKNQLMARQSGTIWMIAVSSLTLRWGEPSPPRD